MWESKLFLYIRVFSSVSFPNCWYKKRLIVFFCVFLRICVLVALFAHNGKTIGRPPLKVVSDLPNHSACYNPFLFYFNISGEYNPYCLFLMAFTRNISQQTQMLVLNEQTNQWEATFMNHEKLACFQKPEFKIFGHTFMVLHRLYFIHLFWANFFLFHFFLFGIVFVDRQIFLFWKKVCMHLKLAQTQIKTLTHTSTWYI